MQIQLKVVFLVALTVAGALAALIWKTSGLVVEGKTEFVADSAERQLAPVRRLVQARLELSRSELVHYAIRRKTLGASDPTSFSKFDAVSLMFEDNARQWAPEWVDKRTGSRAAAWNGGYELTLLKSLPFAKLKDGDVFWVRRSDSEQKDKSIFAIVAAVEVSTDDAPAAATDQALPESTTNMAASGRRPAILVGLTEENPLASVVDDFIGSNTKAFVFDSEGYVAAHTNKGFNGKLFSEDGLVKQALEARRQDGRVSYDDLEASRVDAVWGRVAPSNLAVAVAVPSEATAAINRQILIGMLTVAVGCLVAAVCLAAFVGTRISGNLRRAQRFVAELRSGNFNPTILETRGRDEVAELSALLSQLNGAIAGAGAALTPPPSRPAMDGNETLRQIAQGLSSQLKEPINAILGNAQLLKVKADEAGVGHASAIERDARLVKTVVDLLGRVSGDDPIEMRPSVPGTIADLALSSMERDLIAAGVHVVRSIDSAPNISASSSHLQTALREIIAQSLASMRDRPKKELTVRLVDHRGKAALSIADTGIGLSQDQRERYFEPFYQPFEGSRNPGLGLAVARAVLERHLAEVRVESVPGEGTTVLIEFPASAVQSPIVPLPSVGLATVGGGSEPVPKAPGIPVPPPTVTPSTSRPASMPEPGSIAKADLSAFPPPSVPMGAAIAAVPPVGTIKPPPLAPHLSSAPHVGVERSIPVPPPLIPPAIEPSTANVSAPASVSAEAFPTASLPPPVAPETTALTPHLSLAPPPIVPEPIEPSQATSLPKSDVGLEDAFPSSSKAALATDVGSSDATIVLGGKPPVSAADESFFPPAPALEAWGTEGSLEMDARIAAELEAAARDESGLAKPAVATPPSEESLAPMDLTRTAAVPGLRNEIEMPNIDVSDAEIEIAVDFAKKAPPSQQSEPELDSVSRSSVSIPSFSFDGPTPEAIELSTGFEDDEDDEESFSSVDLSSLSRAAPPVPRPEAPAVPQAKEESGVDMESIRLAADPIGIQTLSPSVPSDGPPTFDAATDQGRSNDGSFRVKIRRPKGKN